MARTLPAAPFLLVGALGLSACASSTETATVDGVAVSTGASTAEFSAPGASIGGGVGFVTLSSPAPEPAPAVLGPWTMARAGDPVCTVDLGSRNAAGDFTAKTRRCTSVELARIAFWTPTPDGLVLYDFDRRPVVSFRRSGPDLFEGVVTEGSRVTLWR
ncbi:MAG TPA: AprI/Inh family metalloprotease inhibitor [Methylomirabilota bacterium]|nr:AprI/Inh family metalloprotease inhibitor [Methylomirabilota bacterium]